MSESLQDQLAKVRADFQTLSDATSAEWKRALGEGWKWDPDELDAFFTRLSRASEQFRVILRRKWELERKLYGPKAP
ncbi:MAG TPA: hypothetical protein VMF12_15240 [Xanthobacteraceae bacterium]|nr:hypothetical protein [Xanthobacteraceae bacterium]